VTVDCSQLCKAHRLSRFCGPGIEFSPKVAEQDGIPGNWTAMVLIGAFPIAWPPHCQSTQTVFLVDYRHANSLYHQAFSSSPNRGERRRMQWMAATSAPSRRASERGLNAHGPFTPADQVKSCSTSLHCGRVNRARRRRHLSDAVMRHTAIPRHDEIGRTGVRSPSGDRCRSMPFRRCWSHSISTAGREWRWHQVCS
jgi:hypothetical protein